MFIIDVLYLTNNCLIIIIMFVNIKNSPNLEHWTMSLMLPISLVIFLTYTCIGLVVRGRGGRLGKGGGMCMQYGCVKHLNSCTWLHVASGYSYFIILLSYAYGVMEKKTLMLLFSSFYLI